MSTKTLRKRIALVAVSAMGFGLMSAAPSSAGVTDAADLGTITSSVPSIVRVNYTNLISLTHTDPGTETGGLGLAVLQQPSGSSISLETSNDTTGIGTTTVFNFNPTVAGSYVVRPYVEAVAGGTYDAGTDTLVGSNFTITVVGAPASFTFGSNVSTGPGGERSVAVNVLDSNGNATLLGSSFISLTVTDSTVATAAAVGTSTPATGVAASLTGTDSTIYISDADAGSTVTVSGLLSVAGTSAQTVTYTTVAQSTADVTDVTIATPAVGNFAATGSTAGARTYNSSLATSSFTATITGLTPGAAYKALIADTIAATDATITTTTPLADANGVGTVVITVPAGALTSETITLTVDKSNTAAGTKKTVVITYSTPAAAFSAANTSPVGGNGVNFTAGNTAKTITATIQDQYGQAIAGSYATASYTTVPAGVTGPTIANAAANASGVATLSTTLPSTAGTYVITVTARTSAGVAIGTTSTITYLVTASGGPGALAISSGVNTATNSYAVTSDDNGSIAFTGAAAAYAVAGTQTTGDYTTIVVNVKNDAGANVEYATVTATPGAGVYVNSAATATALKDFNAAGDLSVVTDTNGNATFYVVGTVVGTSSITFSVGSSSVSGSFFTVLHALDNAVGRTIALGSGTIANTSGAVNQVSATVRDIWGNVVPGVSLTGSVTGAAGRFTGGGRSATVVTDASGVAIFEVTSTTIESGSGTLTVTGSTAAAGSGTIANILSGDLTTNLASLTASPVASASAAITVTLPAVATATLDSIAATLAAMIAQAAADRSAADAAATAAATAATAAAATAAAQDLKIAALQAALDAAATVAATNAAAAAAAATAAATTASTNAAVAATTASTNAATIAAAIAAAQAAAVAAADIAAETAAEAVDAARDAEAAAKAAEEAADLATAAAEQAGEDAVAAAQKAEDAALEAVDAGMNAYDAATGATEAAELAESAAIQAGEDVLAAIAESADAAALAADLASEATAEAIDAATAAGDAASAAGEAADAAIAAAQDAADAANAATAAAQEASDAVAALATQVTTMMSDMKKQITALTNLVIRIQKKVEA